MDKNKEYLDALKIVEEHQRKINKSLVKPLLCICCKNKKIKPVKGSGTADGSCKATEQEVGCWDGGTVSKIIFGYGSTKYDGTSFYFALCDDCAENLEKDKIIVNSFKLYKKEKDLYAGK